LSSTRQRWQRLLRRKHWEAALHALQNKTVIQKMLQRQSICLNPKIFPLGSNWQFWFAAPVWLSSSKPLYVYRPLCMDITQNSAPGHHNNCNCHPNNNPRVQISQRHWLVWVSIFSHYLRFSASLGPVLYLLQLEMGLHRLNRHI
jgi:hypothetical protein